MLICREMSKYFEEFIRTKIDKIDELELKFKGEVTIVISENKQNNKNNSKILSESDKQIIGKMINKLSIKEIVTLINQDNRISKKEIYNYYLKLKNEN